MPIYIKKVDYATPVSFKLFVSFYIKYDIMLYIYCGENIMKKITNENEFLKDLIKNENEFGEVNMIKYTSPEIISSHNLHDFIENLTSKGYIKYIDTTHYRITQAGKSSYASFRKKILKSIISGTKITIREIISFILGILTAVITSIILKRLDLQ